MSEEVKAVHREPHPFVGIQHINLFTGRTVAFVGKVNRIEDGTLYMRTNEGKLILSLFFECLSNSAKCLSSSDSNPSIRIDYLFEWGGGEMSES